MTDDILELPETGRFLILAPHPDDETLGCGGTIAVYAAKGVEVHLAVVSDGAKIYVDSSQDETDIVAIRKQECLEAARILGIKQVYFLNLPDGEILSCADDLAQKVSDILIQITPDVIFAPSPLEFHEDHRAVSSVAEDLLNRTEGVKLAFYEVYGTVRFNCLVDITSAVASKEKAVLSYRSSLYNAPFEYAEVMKGLNRFRSLYAGGKGFHEAFWVVERPLSAAEIEDWLTYGEKTERSDDQRDREEKIVEADMAEREKIIARLLSELETRKGELATARAMLEDVRKEIADMNESIFGKTAFAFYRIRDRLFPESTSRRKLYDRFIALVKRRLSER